MSLEIPRINNLATEKGIARFQNQLEGLLYGEVPMLHFPAEPDINPNRPPLRRHDIQTIINCMRNLGFISRYIKLVSLDHHGLYPTVNKDEGWHKDSLGEGDGLGYYPHIKAIDLRRHTAVKSPALVQARTTMPAPHGNTGFKRDPSAPVYETIQQPGDSVYFVALGGYIGDVAIPQAEHKFVTITEEPRRIHITEFDCRPRI